MINIAIDGPAGAGKSSIAKAAAKKTGFIYVDTGALYRAAALYYIENKLDKNELIDKLPEISVELKYENGEQQVFLNGRNVSGDIRTPEVSMGASEVSAIPEVRDFLFGLQKKIARENDIIMDGRDIGTVVLPDAVLKIYLTATAEERANRRFKEMTDKSVSYEQVLEDIKKRDLNDMNRKTSPLKKADDAVLLDTTEMTIDEVIDTLTGMIEKVKAK